MIEKLKKLSKKELEIFVRQRLGQKDAVLLESGNDNLRQDHLRLSFHTALSDDVLNNASIVGLFNDIWLSADYTDSPIILGYKGDICITSTITSYKDVYNSDYNNPLQELHFSGEGTVKILTTLIKMYIDERIEIHYGIIKLKPL